MASRGGSCLEITIGQFCACLPFTNFLFQRKSKESEMRRQTKRTRPTAHVWFGSIRTQDHTKSCNSAFARCYPPKPPSSECTGSGGCSKGESSGIPDTPRIRVSWFLTNR